MGKTAEKAYDCIRTSSGVASAIAAYFVVNGGEVCTYIFDHYKFCFKCLDSKEKLREIYGSRYVKSNPEGIYKIVQQKGISLILIQTEKGHFIKNQTNLFSVVVAKRA